ncbi:MAG: hypothetical protein ACI4R9_01635 [Kiritimatiellia bacterium]
MQFCREGRMGARAIAAWVAVAALSPMAGTAAEEKSPLEVAQENAALAEKYGKSIVTVRYFVRKNDEGREPRFEVPYRCPNCRNTHWRWSEVSSEKGIPAEFAGFLIAPDRVLMQDLQIDPAFVERIEVMCGGETRKAVEFESVPARRALILKTETPFASGRPLAFTGGPAPKDPRYFYIVRENGLTVSGCASSKAAAFTYFIEPNVARYEGNPNTVVLDERGEPVTVALDPDIVLGQEVFTPPSTWETEPAAKRHERLEAMLARVGRGALPVYLQFEAKAKDGGRGMRFRWSSDGDDLKNDMDAVGLVMANGRVIVLAKLAAADTARLVKLEATLPDGTKVELKFEGTYAEEGAFSATFPNGIPAGVEPFALDGRTALELFLGVYDSCRLANNGGRLKMTAGAVRVTEFERIRGNVSVAEFAYWRGRCSEDEDREATRIVLSADGKLIAIKINGRHEKRHSEAAGVQGAQLAMMVEHPAYDPENVPREAKDRKRTPWLGVDVQQVGADVLREKKARAFFKSYTVDRAALVTEVAPDSPAATLGIKVGDILISAKYPGASSEEELLVERDSLSSLNWEEVFGDDRFIEIGSMGGMTPWPNVEGGVNEVLMQFGVGAEVEIAWVSDGVRRSGKVKLALAPVHFRNAPRVRNKDLSITICDMTAEVRKYFKFDEKSPGVVISKVKGGGTGAVAGLRPLELITEVNGEDVTSAKDFQEKTKDKKELNLTVRRLANTRIVPIKLP